MYESFEKPVFNDLDIGKVAKSFKGRRRFRKYKYIINLLRLHSVLWTNNTTLICGDNCTNQINFKNITQLLSESNLSSLILCRTPQFPAALLLCKHRLYIFSALYAVVEEKLYSAPSYSVISTCIASVCPC